MTEEETNGTDDQVSPDSNAPIWWLGHHGLRSELFVFYQDEHGLHTCGSAGGRRIPNPGGMILFASGMEPRGLARAEALAVGPAEPRIVVPSQTMAQKPCCIVDVRPGGF
jgi:hypothetical protein